MSWNSNNDLPSEARFTKMRCFAMLSDALKSADLTDLRWMRCGCADACAQFDGVREARDAFAMLSHPKTDLTEELQRLEELQGLLRNVYAGGHPPDTHMGSKKQLAGQ